MANIMSQLANSLVNLEVSNKKLSDWEKGRIDYLHQEIVKNHKRVIQAFQDNNRETSMEVIQYNPQILRIERGLRYQHFYKGSGSSSAVSAVFSELTNGLLRFDQHNFNIANVVIGIV